MPTFDFQCQKCEAVFEFTRPFGSKNNPPCPKCKSKKTGKLFTTPTIVFKGEGWYKTAGQAPTGSGTAEPKETKATEPKPEVKTEKPKTDK